MDIKFNIFISHDANDQAIAVELKSFLENIFLNSNVYVSGRDLEGGQTWIENIKLALKSSQVIIALVSKNSINANWLYFESGAGFTDDRTIPLVTDDLQFKDLTPPLSLLQSRMLSAEGISLLLTDISKKLSLRQPTSLPGLEELISRIKIIIEGRTKSKTSKPMVQPQPQSQPVKVVTAVKIDAKVMEAFIQLQQRTKKAVIKKLLSVSDKYNIPNEGELQGKQVSELCNIANAYNVPIPSIANLRLLSASLALPSETDDEWKKVGVLNGFLQANAELDRYEAKV